MVHKLHQWFYSLGIGCDLSVLDLSVATLRSSHAQLGMWLCAESWSIKRCRLMLWLCAKGIWCDMGSCGCVLRVSGVLWVAVVVC